MASPSSAIACWALVMPEGGAMRLKPGWMVTVGVVSWPETLAGKVVYTMYPLLGFRVALSANPGRYTENLPLLSTRFSLTTYGLWYFCRSPSSVSSGVASPDAVTIVNCPAQTLPAMKAGHRGQSIQNRNSKTCPALAVGVRYMTVSFGRGVIVCWIGCTDVATGVLHAGTTKWYPWSNNNDDILRLRTSARRHDGRMEKLTEAISVNPIIVKVHCLP